MKPSRLSFLVFAAGLLGHSQLFAQATWIGAGTAGTPATWSDALNWTGTAPSNGSTTTLTFLNTSANSFATNDITGLIVSSISIPANDGGTPTALNIRDNTITGNPITLAGTVADNTGNWQFLNLDLAMGSADRTFAITNGRLFLGGVLSGAANIIKTGGSDLWLSNANTLTGKGTNVVLSTIAGAATYQQALLFSGNWAGTVALQNTAALGSSTNSVRFSGGGNTGVLDLQTDTSVNAYSIFSGTGNGGAINVGRATAGAGITHNLGVLDLSSVGMTINTGSNVTSGTAGVSFVSLSMSGGNDNNPVTLAGSAAISIGTAGITNSTNTSRRLQLDGTNAGNTIGVINNIAPGASGIAVINLIKGNSSTWTLTANNTYTGTTSINAGTLQLGNGGTTGALAPSSAITNNATLAINRSNTVTQGTDFATTIAGTGVLTKAGAGNLILSGANLATGSAREVLTFTGSSAGSTVTLTHTAALGAAGNSVRFSAGGSGVLDLQTDTSVNAYGISSGTGNGATLTVNRATAGAGITQVLGTLELSSVTLTANTGGNVTSGTAGISFTELKMSGGNDWGPVTLAGSASYSIGSASITANGQSKHLQLDGTSAGNTIGAITNTNNATPAAVVNLIKGNSSTWTLTGTNTYSGTTAVNGGTLKAGSSQALGTNSAVTLTNAASTVLDLNGYSNSIGSLSGGGTTGGNVSLGTATLTVGGDITSPAAYAGVISGSGALVKTGSGTLNLSGYNTYAGGTTVTTGTLQLSSGGGVGAIRGTVTVDFGATLLSTAGDSFGFNTGTKINTLNIVGGTVTHNSGSNATLSSAVINLTGGTLHTTGTGSLDFYNNGSANTAINTFASDTSSTLAGKVNLRQGDNNSTGTVFTVADGAAAADLIVSAAMVNGPYQGGNSIVQKSGPGVMVLSGANTYTGATLVDAGTLALVGGSQASPVSVASGATLGFTLGSPATSSSTVTFSGATAKVAVAGTPVAATLMTASNIIGTPVLEPAIPGYVLAVEGGGTQLNLKAAVANNYATWAATNGATGQAANLDHDNDGVSNGVEYFLGGPTGNTTGFTALPGVTTVGSTRSVTWVKAASYTGVYGSDYVVETSTTLAAGSWTPEPSPGNVSVTGNNVTYTFPAGPEKQFARLNVTGP